MERPAGLKIIEFFTETPLGEELLEGGGGGLMVGLGQIGSDKSAGQIALETAAAMLGGVAMGAGGRRIGARIGKAVHKGDLADQGGVPAFIGRTFGNETTAKGMKENALMGKEAIRQSLIEQTTYQLAEEAMASPRGFLAKYGMDPQEFLATSKMYQSGSRAAAGLRAMETMTPEQREAVLVPLRQAGAKYKAVEDLIARAAHDGFEANVARLANNSEEIGDSVRRVFRDADQSPEWLGDFLGDKISGGLSGLDGVSTPVTGEHVGKAIGRFVGDEVGILGGMAMGSLLAQQLGIESPKDRRIRELEQQLAGKK